MRRRAIVAVGTVLVAGAVALPMPDVIRGRLETAGCGDVVDGDRQPRLLASGFLFTEGPAWHHDGYWVFSDIRADTIYKLDADGRAQPFKRPSGHANGNAFDRAGNLISARHDRLITLTRADGGEEVLAAAYQGRKLNSPNDLVIGPDGAVWFTDPPYGISGNGPARADEEQPVRGVYRLRDGTLQLMSGELTLPNGLAFSPDGRWLYVSDSADGAVYRFAVGADGTLTDKSFFARVRPGAGQRHATDGIKTDAAGRVWASGARAIGVFDPSGELRCRIDLGERRVTNLAFGGPDGRDLLITTGDSVLALRAKVPGRRDG